MSDIFIMYPEKADSMFEHMPGSAVNALSVTPEAVLHIPRAKLRKLSACENRLLLLCDGKFQFMHAPA